MNKEERIKAFNELEVMKAKTEEKIGFVVGNLCEQFEEETGFPVKGVSVYFVEDHPIGREKKFLLNEVKIEIHQLCRF